MATLAARRIGLNAHLLNLSGNYRSAGINWYIYHLLRNLPEPSFDFTAFLSEPHAREHLASLELVTSRLPTHNPVLRVLWEQFVQPLELSKHRIDLLHALAFAGPIGISIPWVVTVYDLSFILFPKSFNTLNRLYLRWAVRDSVRRTARVIAISECTRQDLIAQFGVPPDKVAVVHCGLDSSFAPCEDNADINMLRRRRHLPDYMILHVGTLEPRKNVARLVRAYASAKRKAHLPHHLVLAGARGWKYGELDTAIEQEKVSDSVHLAGYVPQEELPLWYQAADLFVFPSLYEGFGLPPLEAMASGTPVITSRASSLPEVVGDAGLLVSPEDEAELADAIIRAVSDRPLHEQMKYKGLVRAGQFSWSRAAQETRAVYDSVLAGETKYAPA